MAWTLYYDGGCNLCNASKLRVVNWAARQNFPLEVDILQSPAAFEKGYGEAMTLEADGQVYRAFEAWRKLMEIAPPGLRWVGKVAHWPLISSVMRFGYGVIAKYRNRWFGTRACTLPKQG